MAIPIPAALPLWDAQRNQRKNGAIGHLVPLCYRVEGFVKITWVHSKSASNTARPRLFPDLFEGNPVGDILRHSLANQSPVTSHTYLYLLSKSIRFPPTYVN